MKLVLPYGLRAELIEGEPDAAAVRAPSGPTRRWAKNGHLWETCPCVDCRGRRAGGVDPGPNYRPETP